MSITYIILKVLHQLYYIHFDSLYIRFKATPRVSKIKQIIGKNRHGSWTLDGIGCLAWRPNIAYCNMPDMAQNITLAGIGMAS